MHVELQVIRCGPQVQVLELTTALGHSALSSILPIVSWTLLEMSTLNSVAPTK
jgi:hypothetical protein